ncbi:hypothetical protein LJC24_01030 [Desulfococcaceae bacterium OttesenSCG-928-F15]|nr:hypothetical protein [Desulfococcaceae bacterium OttesenSCG-928-F15]
MVFCYACGKEIHESASLCPQCGARQHSAEKNGTLWLPIPAMICGLIPLVALLDESPWDKDTYMGAILFAVIAIILAIISLSIQKRGRAIAIIAIIAALISLGALIEMYETGGIVFF